MGDLVFNVYANLTNLVGADKITAYGVHYPAVSLLGSLSNVINGAGAFLHIKPLGAYTDSVRQGTQDVQNQIETVHASCPTTQFILSGYSQGAQAVGDALQRMPVADQQLVVAATFLAIDILMQTRGLHGPVIIVILVYLANGMNGRSFCMGIFSPTVNHMIQFAVVMNDNTF